MLREISEKEYNKFIENYPNSLFFQSISWGHFKKNTGWTMEIIGLEENKEIKAAAILLGKKVPILNKTMYYCPRGFIIDFSDLKLIERFTRELKKYIKEKKVLFLKINPYIDYNKRDKDGNIESEKPNEIVDYLKSLGYAHYGFYTDQKDKKELEPRWVSVLNIENKTEEELLKEMRSTTRWQINKARKNCIEIKEASYEDIDKFKDIMIHTSDRREFDDRPLSYYQEMYKTLKEENIYKLMLAYIDLKKFNENNKEDLKKLEEKIERSTKENQKKEFISQKETLEKRINKVDEEINKYGEKPCIAGGIYLSFGDQIVYLYGGSYKEFMSYGAQFLLQDEMIKYGIENNYKKLNFYGIDGLFTKDSKNYGLFDFKRGFGADVVELIGEFDLPSNKFIYRLYRIMFSIYKKLRHIKTRLKK